jgi:hypothetical protein
MAVSGVISSELSSEKQHKMPDQAKKEPPYGSHIALPKLKKPFQLLPPKPQGNELIASLETLAPKAAKRLVASKCVIFHAVGDTGGVNGTEVEERIADAMQAQISEDTAHPPRNPCCYLL